MSEGDTSNLNQVKTKLEETTEKLERLKKKHANEKKKWTHKTEKETILLIGGWGGGQKLDKLLLLKYRGENAQRWEELTIRLPYAISRHGAQFLNDHIYIFGGGSERNEILNTTYKLSKNLKWDRVANMKERRYAISNSSVILNNCIWVLGGCSGQEWLNSVEVYNPAINEWLYMASMNEYRANAAATVINDKIICCGGGNGNVWLDSVEIYDPFSNIWTFCAYLPQPTTGHVAVEIGGNLNVIGGWTGECCMNAIWTLDAMGGSGYLEGFSSMPYSHCEHSAAVIDNKLYVCGGDCVGWVTDAVDIYDGGMWWQGPKLTSARCNAALTVIPGHFAQHLK